MCIHYTDGVVCVFMVMLKMLKLSADCTHLDLYCNATQCIGSEVMQGSNKKVDWGIKGIRVRNVGHQNRSEQVLQQNVSEKCQHFNNIETW